jgi:hypothetical protein
VVNIAMAIRSDAQTGNGAVLTIAPATITAAMEIRDVGMMAIAIDRMAADTSETP